MNKLTWGDISRGTLAIVLVNHTYSFIGHLPRGGTEKVIRLQAQACGSLSAQMFPMK
jgi:hypothetical protein